MTEIEKIKWQVWAMAQDNARRGESIDKSINREETARRRHMTYEYPGEFDASPYEQYRELVRCEIAKTETTIRELLSRLGELEKGGAEA